MDLLTMLENSWPARVVADSIWGFPILEIVHLCGLTVVFGGMLMLDTRLLGMQRHWPVRALQRYLLRHVWAGFALAALSGAWLFCYEAHKLADDGAFLLKMLLIPLAGLNALFMHRVAMRGIAAWDVAVMPPPLVRLSAAASLLLWIAILACGRLIAYFYPYA